MALKRLPPSLQRRRNQRELRWKGNTFNFRTVCKLQKNSSVRSDEWLTSVKKDAARFLETQRGQNRFCPSIDEMNFKASMK
jgi:hypothetical protein